MMMYISYPKANRIVNYADYNQTNDHEDIHGDTLTPPLTCREEYWLQMSGIPLVVMTMYISYLNSQ